LNLRPYQLDAEDDIRAAFRQHRRVLLVLPTGGGKTVIFSDISAKAAGKNNRITILAHRREICDQISTALDSFGIRHGMIAPGLKMTADRVQVGMVQTVARRLDKMDEPDLLVVDEAHHATAGTWEKIMLRWKRAKVLGVTATAIRTSGKGLGAAFDTLIQGPSMSDLIRMGYLSDFDYLAPPPVADLSGVKTRLGDYALEDLAMEMDKAVVVGDSVGHYAKYLAGRPTVAFCVTIAHAQHVAAAFNAQGWRAASIDGGMDKAERNRLLGDLAAGRLSVLTSAELISEGVDIPVVAGAILLRPTKSLTVYLQQVGRALRVKPDGGRALVLDHVGNVHRHGRPDDPRTWTLENKAVAEVVKTRTCKTCFKVFPAGTGPCGAVDCGLIAQAGVERALEHVDGELVEISSAWDWTGGIDVARAAGPEWRALLEKAGTDRDRINQIRRARGYKHGWTKHVLEANAQRELEKVGIL
jgi:superfamily II DNA or RNA helicase